MKGRHAAALVGRHARLELAFDYRSGRTVLSHAYAEPPFRVGRTFEAGSRAGLILVSDGPGVFAGDWLRQSIRVGPGARVMIASQSAIQVHPGASSEDARVDLCCEIDEGGELNAHADPVIPFAGSRVCTRIDLRLEPSARLYWSEALMSGRCGRGERWMFDRFAHELRVQVGDQLKYLERSRIVPAERRPAHPWLAGSADYIGTTLVYGDGVDEQVAEALQRRLDGIGGVRAGVDCPEPGLLVCRMLARRGTAFAHARSVARDSPIPGVESSGPYLRK